MAEARRREVDEHRQCSNVPRSRSVFFKLGDDELDLSIYSDEAQKRRVRVRVQLRVAFV